VQVVIFDGKSNNATTVDVLSDMLSYLNKN